MNHDLNTYVDAKALLVAMDAQLTEFPLQAMEDRFEAQKAAVEDYNERKKMDKAFKRMVKEVKPLVTNMYRMQVRLMALRPNVEFLLECAHNKVSYKALARKFAEYNVVAKEVLKEARKCKNDMMTDFLETTPVLEMPFFKVMESTASVMQQNMKQRMERHPEQYLDLDTEADSAFELADLKAAFKEREQELKEEKEKNGML